MRVARPESSTGVVIAHALRKASGRATQEHHNGCYFLRPPPVFIIRVPSVLIAP